MPPADDDAPVDAAIASALARAEDAQWQALWAAHDALAGLTTFAVWAGGDVIGTTVVDGEERNVHQLPYPVYAEPVARVRHALGALGLFVPFDWPGWAGVKRYRAHPEELADAPVGDAVRLLTAIQRSERFSDGSIEGALQSGAMQAALARLRRWYDEERVRELPR
jgi:hypothetical protein